jgi:hypothetical protein
MSLIQAIEQAPDPNDVRIRLRAVLRRVIESIWVLVVPRNLVRLCAVQIRFAEGDQRRSYLLMHRPPKANGVSRREGAWWARSFADAVPAAADFDLRRPEDVAELERVLGLVDLDGLA